MTSCVNLNSERFDVVVIGAGHAGVEAALASARLGCRTLLITQMQRAIARMPCNPSIGGIAKSHLVFELDALGGEMARTTDATGIQFRVLNASRGPAVQANRAQCDKVRYAARMQQVVFATPNLTVLEDEVSAIWIQDGNRLRGIRAVRAGEIPARSVVFATGTALAGKIHIGQEVVSGGGDGRPAAEALSASIREAGFKLIRFKTGTPPRLDARTIDWSRTTIQPGDVPPPLFSWHFRRRKGQGTWDADQNIREMFHVEHCEAAAGTDRACLATGSSAPPVFHVEQSGKDGQMPCWLTNTTAETHRIIRENLSRSALYGGGITGTGARYCPSVEDKVVKFPDKEAHHVFLEPEGVSTNRIYPNGISNSLDREVQVALVHSIPSLEKAAFLAYAYAIEYDCIDTLELGLTLESRRIPGLFFAGQINRTTGYEEAAAQGFMAGVNAAFLVFGRAPFTLSRQDAYIGILIDDLVTTGTNEPYRMFTSRAERRLILRQDNARFRLAAQAGQIGIAPKEFLNETESFAQLIATEQVRLESERRDGILAATLLARPHAKYDDMPHANVNLPQEVKEQIEIHYRYRGYIQQEEQAARHARADEHVRMPGWLDYWRVPALRYEAREKLHAQQPVNLGQAARIPGVTPADIAVLAIALKRGPPA
ncbi:MAG: tRNA uridine-5-carboxymethylaminomethyl modification enzyme MnmG/GidA [Kiritimatiellia bacterium]